MVLIREDYGFVLFCLICCLKCGCFSGLGKCPKMEYIRNFNISQFKGHWYEIERSFYLMEVVMSCVNMDLQENPKGQLQVSINTKSRWSGSLSISEGLASQSKKHPSIFIYKVTSDLPRAVNRYLPGSGSYQVLATDYKRYAVLYSCTNYGVAHTDLIWVWGRTQEIDAELRSEIYTMLSQKNLDSERLILPKNENCTD